MTDGPPTVLVTNGRLVTPTGVVEGAIRLADGEIAAVDADPSAPADERIDAGGAVVLPGLVDVHGDDVEHHLFPRDHAELPPETALETVDRTNLTAGITTKFHALAFEETPEKNRSPAFSKELAATIDGATTLVADHRINARCRVSELSAVRAVERVVDEYAVDLVSIGAVEPGKGQFTDADAFVEWYAENDGNRRKAEFTAAEAREYVSDHPGAIDGTLDDRIERVASRVRDAEAVLSSHDDESATEVRGLHDHGATISEYPVTMEAARTATSLDVTTTMGAPNLLQGGSLFGNLDVAAAIDADLLDVLCVDYYPPSLLASVFVDTGEPLHHRVARVTKNPADAVGLSDRGRLEAGARADLVVVDPEPTPTVEHVVVGGRPVFRPGAVRRA